MPYVSVVIPLYQTERYIAGALASVLAQTFTDFEVLVIDDGSSDNGPAIARANPDPRICVITQSNRGLAGARNAGIARARGTLLAFLDADDAWHPEKLERHIRHLEASPEIGVSFSASRFIGDHGAAIGLIQKPAATYFEPADIFCRNPVGNGSAPVIRRATLDAIAFHDSHLGRTCWFDESFRQSEDIECWTRIAATTPWRFGFIDAALTDYRVNTTGLSANTARQLETWHRFRTKVEGYAPSLAARHAHRAEAYQLRYLARRAVAGNAANSPAFAMMMRALRLHPRLLVEEPARTLVTLAASCAQKLLPQALFELATSWAMARATRMRGLRV